MDLACSRIDKRATQGPFSSIATIKASDSKKHHRKPN